MALRTYLLRGPRENCNEMANRGTIYACAPQRHYGIPDIKMVVVTVVRNQVEGGKRVLDYPFVEPMT